MEKESAINQTLEQLHERRKQVIRLHRRGIKIMQLTEMTGLSYPAMRTVSKYLARWGFTPQKPIKRAYEQRSESDKLIEFMEVLIKDVGKKVVLILDTLRVHHSTPVKAWLAERPERIEVFYLPSYSPELNPEERLNADLKQAMSTRVPVRAKAKLREATNEPMSMLEKSHERVMSFFQNPRVKYAAG